MRISASEKTSNLGEHQGSSMARNMLTANRRRTDTVRGEKLTRRRQQRKSLKKMSGGMVLMAMRRATLRAGGGKRTE